MCLTFLDVLAPSVAITLLSAGASLLDLAVPSSIWKRNASGGIKVSRKEGFQKSKNKKIIYNIFSHLRNISPGHSSIVFRGRLLHLL